MFSSGTAVGASGAINGIVGMYLVFFPENSISCFFWFIYRPFFFSVSGFWMILLWFAFDIFGAMRGSTGVAYIAHIGGFLSGFGLAVLMLKLEWIKMERDEKSILQMFRPKSRKIPIRQKSKSSWQQKMKNSVPKTIKPEISKQERYEPKEEFIRFKCRCEQKIKVPRVYAGKKGRCPKCKIQLTIPQM